MAEERLHQPHDKLIKSSFEDKETAVAFFRQYLPPTIVHLISWPSLTLVPGSYIDDRLRGSESDRLYRVILQSSTSSAPVTEAFIYLLFEHQRLEDHWIAFRLLTYQVRIWEQFRSAHPLAQTLPRSSRSSWPRTIRPGRSLRGFIHSSTCRRRKATTVSQPWPDSSPTSRFA